MITTKQLISCPAFVPVHSGVWMWISVSSTSKSLETVYSDKSLIRNAKVCGSIPHGSTIPSNFKMKKCPHCDKVLMASILPQCSWCGGELKENELRKSQEEILKRWEKDKKDNEYQKI